MWTFLRHKNNTLRLTFPFGRVLLLSLVMVAAVLAAAEILLRRLDSEGRLPVPTVGVWFEEFEPKLHLFQQTNKKEKFDCIFLGSSVVDHGLDPLAFEQAYYEQTGQRLHCFNFGVSAGGENSALVLADLLVRHYHPRLLIFGVSPRQGRTDDPSPIANRAWTRYQLGDFNLEGWLYEHSATMRYSLVYARWLLTTNTSLKQRQEVEDILAAHQGYDPSTTTMAVPLDSADQDRVRNTQFTLTDSWRARLDQILAFQHPPETIVLLVEIPVSPLAFDAAQDYADYQQSMQEIATRASEKGVFFWPTTRADVGLQNEDWRNINHLNYRGAGVFSAWYGKQVGIAVTEGKLTP